MTGLIQPMQFLACEVRDATRAALRRVALIGAALLIATLGIGFLILAAYLGLRLLLGPILTALVLGTVLLVVSAVLVLAGRAKAQKAKPLPLADPREKQSATAPPTPADAATMAVFMVAFLIGRRLADRWGQGRDS